MGKRKKPVADIKPVPEKANSSADLPENIDHNKHSLKLSNEQTMARFNPVVKLKRLKPQDSILTPYSRVVQPQKAIVKPQMLSHVIDSYVVPENIDHNKHFVKLSNEQKMARFNPFVKLKRLKPQNSTLTPYSRVVKPQKAIVKPRVLSHVIDSYATEEDAGPALASAEPNWKQVFDSPDSQPTCIKADTKEKSSRRQDQKPVKVNQYWTAEEQKQLDKLLVKFPPEEIESQRWEKIANCLENRSPEQVKNKVREYSIKLLKAGMPIPGRMPEKYLGKKYDDKSDADYVEDEDEEEEDDEDECEEEVDDDEIYDLWLFDEEGDEEDYDEEEEEAEEDNDEIFNQWLYDDESDEDDDDEDEEEEDEDENDHQCLLK